MLKSTDEQKVHIENGITYFNTPYKTNDVEFAFAHPGCDFIFRVVEPDDGGTVNVYAVSCTSTDNSMLQEIFTSSYPEGYRIMRGVEYEPGVGYID